MRRLALITVVLVVACRARDGAVVRDSTFIATMAELQQLSANGPGDSAARAAVLRRHKVTLPALERTARALAADPKHAARVWSAIEQGPSPAPVPPAPIPPAPVPPGAAKVPAQS